MITAGSHMLTPPKRAGLLPAVQPAAWHGPLGELVCRIAPVTEADPIAMLATLLGLFGAMVGDGPHIRVGGVRHPARIWPLIIGKTGAGRKGTSFAEARSAARRWSPYADGYIRGRVVSGLSSGEGLLAALGAGEPKTDNPDDQPAAPDGRLTVIESEFARVLAAAKRDGNTLGQILRQMWDDGSAAILTRAAPLKVDGAHLGLVAHITPRELKLRLAEADVAGGTVNRFLLVASERPHLLPYEKPHPDLADLTEWLGRAVETALHGTREVRRDREANELWEHVYAALSDEEPDGQLGSVLARGPAYTMRIALTYALADGSSTISKHHLLAALSVWQYSAATARLVFTSQQTLDNADRLAAYVSAAGGGRTRTELYRYFRNHLSAEALDALLEQLEHGREVTVERDEATVGRPAQRYRWTGRPRDRMAQLLLEHWELRTN